MGRFLKISAGVVCLLLAWQAASWALLGSSQLVGRLPADIVEVVNEDVFLATDSLNPVPLNRRANLKSKLLSLPDVFSERELPEDNVQVTGYTSDGRPIHQYKVPILRINRWRSTPLDARVRITVYTAPLEATGYELKYIWCLGRWIHRKATNSARIS